LSGSAATFWLSFTKKLFNIWHMSIQKITLALLAVLSAILLTLASPGNSSGYFVFVAFIPLFICIKKSDKKEFIIYVLVFTLIYYFYNLNWITVTVSHFGNAPLPVGYLVLFIFSVYLSLYWILFFYFFRNNYSVILLSLLFVTLEIIRGKLFTGFPWLNLGSFVHNLPYFKLNASLIGENGLSFIIILTNLLLFKYITNKSFKYLIYPVIILILSFSSGFILSNLTKASAKTVSFTIVQPSYSQEIKWAVEHREEIISNVLDMTEKALKMPGEIVILPESVFPTFTETDSELYNKLKNFSRKKPLIFGSIRNDNGTSSFAYYNSVYYLQNARQKIYDKIHLVPFGEYFPFKTLFKPISYYFFGDAEDFSGGNTVSIFEYNGYKISPLLCYEGAFTNLVKKVKDNGGNIIVLLTNDSWFGKSMGRYQHLAIDKIRSIEYGTPIIRAAQSGISGCIDMKGNISSATEIDEKTSFSCVVRIPSSGTFFNKYGYAWLIVLILFYSFKWVTGYPRKK